MHPYYPQYITNYNIFIYCLWHKKKNSRITKINYNCNEFAIVRTTILRRDARGTA